ncbi:MAG TPA: class I SAM-dependent methyltransferase, partial [Pyrinomonadaceae bacterium]
MESVTCNLCGSAEHRAVYSIPDVHYFRDEWFTVVECLGCGLGFVNPRPTREEIFRHYPADFYGYFDREKNFNERRYELEARLVEAAAGAGLGKSLLDVGCANGDFPRLMLGRGWEVEGVEVSPNARAISDFKVYTEEFARIPVRGPRYDVLTAWAVLEHVHDPVSYFKKASEVLKPGGVFMFLVTNFASLSSRALFREDVPRHLYFYTEETVGRYLALSGLELVRADYGNELYEMRPVGWLRYYVYRYLLGREMKFDDIPPNRVEYLAARGLTSSLFSNLRYVFTHPFTVID